MNNGRKQNIVNGPNRNQFENNVFLPNQQRKKRKGKKVVKDG